MTPIALLLLGCSMAIAIWVIGISARDRSAADRVCLAVVLGVLAAACNLIIPIPNVEVATTLVMVAAVTLGVRTSLLVGAIAVLGSSLSGGVGPWTAWQIVGFAAVAVVARAVLGDATRARHVWALAATAVLATLVYDALVTGTSLQLTGATAGMPASEAFRTAMLLGLPFTLLHVMTNVVCAVAIGPPLIDGLARARGRMHGPAERHGGRMHQPTDKTRTLL
jgi:hypothetical protein